ncbi:MAG: alpha/beta hydrolase [Faecalibacterium sp.]|nr:alpha/beta hydrolase [Faecalibacterium sp.]
MIKKWKVTIPELTGRKRRWAYVYLPTMYKAEPRRRFPVLYMFDGHNVFFDADATYGKSWGLAEYLDYHNVPVIVAAVECNHGKNNERLSEYSPFDFSDGKWGSFKGQGKTTMDWFVGSFKPYIDKRFRTLPGRETTMIAGSSMGGLMSLYAVTRYNKTFSRAAALSPSVWVDLPKLTKLLQTAPLGPDTVLYMDYGSQELGNHKDMARGLRQVADTLFDRGVFITARFVPHGTHSEASWEKQLPLVMETLMYGLDD